MILKCWNKQEREIYDMNSMQIPAHVEQIIHTLNSHGYEAFAVGGCVRDTLLGRKPGDWDITTSARPEQVKALFRRTIDTGIQHGTVTIMMDRTGYEVTTYFRSSGRPAPQGFYHQCHGLQSCDRDRGCL